MKALKGGEFLIKKTLPEQVFIPEEFDEEQKMIAETCQSFLEQEVFPNLDRIDALEEGLMPSLLDKAGELGLLGISIPEEYGGFGKDFITGMLANEKLGAGHSFAVAQAAHNGIGTLPILYFGNEEQKKKYIPKLASGALKASYCLTEPGAGSDANSGKTKATLSSDGKHWILNGQKMWITNAGFADIFTVFAKIDNDENLSAFIVEKSYGGIELNPEEKKMGIKGSSTRQVFFTNCQIPVENLLGQRQEGFKIALYILNIGRIKLAGAALGGAKEAINQSIKYAVEREQFGRIIGKYGAIKYKLAEQAIRTFALDSALYRCSSSVQNAIKEEIENGKNKQEASLTGIKEYAVEAAILKIFGSEVLDYVVDEAVQIYGGMGYSAEGPVERAYRDSRINRIFEGTNEINRMLIVDMLLKKAMKGELDLLTPAMAVTKELMSIPDFSSTENTTLSEEKKVLANFKKAILMTAGAAAQKLMANLAKEQEIIMNISDMIIDLYVSESVLLRTEKLIAKNGEQAYQEQIAIAKVFIYDAADRIAKAGKDAINSFAEGDEQRMMLMGLKRFTKINSINAKEYRRSISDKLMQNTKFCF
ncbi:MAG: acyl-CoA dehydrogenase [Bacteroidetes bacterium]|nr:acyl-CoA dehydrogenase [Bacteroidota bacterium]MBV6460114.1 putative acyl-CoA dehydrogenase [Flavobacteriales bacterium]WKZ73985.1 MAG: acyl-CoA dehydrogenase family protein [Vicingaceae bacterium]MCL4816464.1 acyl-CoA dehydrogenase family protein [Flavobacteriales bacterium]NOG95427.1 acyl-CoA dehydrogenase [Bacteroidota bacterium]